MRLYIPIMGTLHEIEVTMSTVENMASGAHHELKMVLAEFIAVCRIAEEVAVEIPETLCGISYHEAKAKVYETLMYICFQKAHEANTAIQQVYDKYSALSWKTNAILMKYGFIKLEDVFKKAPLA